ncbi:RluA family pseudouridine synthase [Salinibius halmophilus]|uniref:RluA family pseudouridine synthase n=1 Tax=Salinibius halmophilus TaxID=1853216 RepID=UPI000E66C0FA|nr:RluA family pseudouridine synthase [Salinibius halmophilus]
MSQGVRFVTINEDNDGQRLDNFLMSQLKGVPKSLVYRIIRKGEVRVNKKRCKQTDRLAIDDVVRIPPVRVSEPSAAAPASEQLKQTLQARILYEDDVMIAVNKPHGLAVHGGSGVKLGLIEALRQLYPQQKFLELVHRLDRDTSGVILVAKKRSALKHLHDQLRGKTMRKIYHCVVLGRWPDGKSAVDAPLERYQRGEERLVRVSRAGKPSVTGYKVLKRGKGWTLMEASPKTGRTHQIRVHCLYGGGVIAGDEKYCTPEELAYSKSIGCDRLMLHAAQLTFQHPRTGKRLTLDAPKEGVMLNF